MKSTVSQLGIKESVIKRVSGSEFLGKGAKWDRKLKRAIRWAKYRESKDIRK